MKVDVGVLDLFFVDSVALVACAILTAAACLAAFAQVGLESGSTTVARIARKTSSTLQPCCFANLLNGKEWIIVFAMSEKNSLVYGNSSSGRVLSELTLAGSQLSNASKTEFPWLLSEFLSRLLVASLCV